MAHKCRKRCHDPYSTPRWDSSSMHRGRAAVGDVGSTDLSQCEMSVAGLSFHEEFRLVRLSSTETGVPYIVREEGDLVRLENHVTRLLRGLQQISLPTIIFASNTWASYDYIDRLGHLFGYIYTIKCLKFEEVSEVIVSKILDTLENTRVQIIKISGFSDQRNVELVTSLQSFVVCHPELVTFWLSSSYDQFYIVPFEALGNLNALEFLDIDFKITKDEFVECFRCLFRNGKGKSIRELNFGAANSFEESSCLLVPKYLQNQFNLRSIKIDFRQSSAFAAILSRNDRIKAIAEVQQCVEDNIQASTNRGKIIFLGNGGAGKTTTRKHIFNEKYDIREYDSTEVAEANQTGIVSQLEGSGWKAKVKTNKWVQNDFDRCYFPEIEVSDTVLETVGRNYVAKQHGVRKGAKSSESKARHMLDMAENYALKRNVLDNSGPQFSLWDFGGQEVFYALHPIFLTDNALYLLVVNLAQFEKNTEEEKANFTFWMDSLKLHAPTSPVMVIGTFTDQVKGERTLHNFHEFLSLYQEKSTQKLHFNDVISFFPLSNKPVGKKPRTLKPGKIMKFRTIKTLLLRQKSSDKMDSSLFSGSNMNSTFSQSSNRSEKPQRPEMLTIRENIELLSKREQNNSFSRFVHHEFPSSWLYFMGFISESYGDYVSINTLEEEAEDFSIGDSLVELFKFFADSGTILFFENLDSRDNLVILNPQWLMTALASLIFDPKLHMRKKMNLLSEADDIRKLTEFANSGIVSRKLLPKIYPELEKETIGFLVSLGIRLMLIADYFHPSYEEQNILIASMLRKTEKPMLDEEDFHIWAKFDILLPIGYFSRFVAYFVQKVQEYGSVAKPSISENYALFKIRQEWTFQCFTTGDGTGLKFFLNPRSVPYAHQVHQLVEEAIESALNSTSTNIKYDMWVKRDKIVVLLEDVFQAIEMDQTEILSKDKRLVSVEGFRIFYTPVPDLEEEFDCFLSHSWGYSGETHHVVKRIYGMLSPDVNCWFDDVCLNGHIYQSMCNGIKQSKTYVIFLSQRLMDSVEKNSGNVAREFYYLTAHGRRKPIVLVVLEGHLLDPSNWADQFEFMIRRTTPVIDMSSDEMIEQNYAELRRRILNLQESL